MSFVYGTIYLVVAVLIGYVLIKPLHHVLNPGLRSPTSRELIEVVAYNLVLAHIPAVIITCLSWLLLRDTVTLAVRSKFPVFASHLSGWELAFILFVLIYTCIVCSLSLATIKEKTRPAGDDLSVWHRGMAKVQDGMARDRKASAGAKKPSRRKRKVKTTTSATSESEPN